MEEIPSLTSKTINYSFTFLKPIPIFFLTLLFRISPSLAGFDKKNSPSGSGQSVIKGFQSNRTFRYKVPRSRSFSRREISMVNPADTPGWIVGFTDGEGCFSVSFNLRESMTVGVETRPSFAVGQKSPSLASLEKMRNFFGCGHIRYSKRDGTYKYEVRNIDDLVNKIIPFYEKHSLETLKKDDFNLFAEICRSMKQGSHLNEEGMKKIIEKGYSMNPSGQRKRFIEELMNAIDKKVQSKKKAN